MKKGVMVIIMLMTISTPFVSAGLFDFVERIFGGGNTQLSTGETDVSVTVGNDPPVIESVSSVAPVDLSPGTTTNVIFTFTASDPNGASTLSDGTADASFSRSGETTRTASSCILDSSTANDKTYQCTVPMQYYDEAGDWTVSVSISDSGGETGQDSTSMTTVQLLRSIVISPSTFSFPAVSPGTTANVLSLVDTVVTNKGNYEVPGSGAMFVTGYALVGETTSAESLPTSSFKVSGRSGTDVCGVDGTTLVESTAVPVGNANLARGAIGNSEDLTFCLTTVPVVSSQTYSTAGGTRWSIGI